MKSQLVIFSILSLSSSFEMTGQISHGGHPLPLTNTRSITDDLFETMPSFNLEAQLQMDSTEYNGLKNSNRFAYKFMTDYDPSNSGTHYTLNDGTKIWRLGIRSKGAESINLLFTEYELPEGAKLFIYDPNQRQIKGSFTHQNNSDKGILPIAPIYGDELIIEYQEPANAAFTGRLRLGEVNHGYRRIIEPSSEPNINSCMPPLVCSLAKDDPYQHIGQSAVLLIIDGTYYCSGTLINNTRMDGTPYLLTASHCLNENFSVKNQDYEEIAGKIIAFFNYNSPTCESPMKGTEEMSMVSSHFRAVNESTDMALLELLAIPPIYYRPYYAGFNATETHKSPYVCIQHPQGGTKRFSIAEKVKLNSFVNPDLNLDKMSFWHVPEWNVGSTAAGSSGAALFDENFKIIGALTGGASTCFNPKDDFFYSLSHSWEKENREDLQLKHWLSPNSNKTSCEGMNPYENSSAIRLSHVFESNKYDQIETHQQKEEQFSFGLNDSGYNEFAEKYTLMSPAWIYGCYLTTPPITDADVPDIEICLYKGKEKPETLLSSEKFNPVFPYIEDDQIKEQGKQLRCSQEHFIAFEKAVKVDENLFIGYKINNKSSFCVYNIKGGEISQNSVWIKTSEGWKESNLIKGTEFNTALFIDPVISYASEATSNENIETESDIRISFESASKTIHIITSKNQLNYSYILTGANGKVIDKQNIHGGYHSFSYQSLSSGIYFLKISNSKGVKTQKILFQ